MSTSRTPEPVDWSERISVAADAERLGAVRERGAAVMAVVPAMTFLAYLDRGALPARYGRGPAADLAADVGPAADFAVLALELTRVFGEWDDALQKVGTGRLIRVVLRTDHHALCYDAVRPGATGFLGVVTLPSGGGTDDAVLAADIAIADLADHFRDLDGMPPANPGGYKHRYPGRGPRLAEDGSLAERLRACVDYEGLHFASFWAGGRRVAVEHCFDDDRLAGAGREDAKLGMTPRLRLAGHVEIARRLGDAAKDLKTTSGGALRGKLNLIVLDVEDGAVFYARLGPRRYLTTATLVQTQVEPAAELTEQLVRALRPLEPAGRTRTGPGS